MDPERPAKRLRGNGTPYDRRGESPGSDPDGWSNDASYLVLKRMVDQPDKRGVTKPNLNASTYDFGMAHRQDKGLVEAHRYTQSGGVASRGGHSIRGIVDRHQEGTECRWLVYNTWLAPGQVLGYKFEIPNSDRRFRKEEIGTVIDSNRYDVALLNEVFHGNHWTSEKPGTAIRKNAGRVVDHRRGPDKGTNLTRGKTGKLVDSGLLGMTLDNSVRRTPRIVDHATGTFDALSGQDIPANKGWLFLELDLGPGNVDVFLTHTNSQHNDLESGESPGKHQRIRKQNIGVVLDAVDVHGSRKNVTVVCGDLNIRGDYDEYDWLLRKMNDFGLHDVYLTHGGIETSTSYYDIARGTGSISDELTGVIKEVTEDGGSRYPEKCRRHGDLCHCDDYVVSDQDATKRGEKYEHHNKRLDYIFVEKPRPAHTIDLDLLRVRRRIFPRYGPVADPPNASSRCGPTYSTDIEQHQDTSYLSDHMGLEMHTIASPKT
jgi:hypothetical protein